VAGGHVTPTLRDDFIAAGHAYHIPPEVLAGVGSIESGLGANKGPSSAGAVGLMQFEPGTAAGLGINPRDDRQAIFGAAKYLNQLGYQKDPRRALAAYNGGPGNPQFSYADKVLQEAKRLAPEVKGGGRVTQVPTTRGVAGASDGGDHPGFTHDLLKLALEASCVAGGGFLVYEGARRVAAPVRGRAAA
jgi:soluble lytic murein transglycosylase-like protein